MGTDQTKQPAHILGRDWRYGDLVQSLRGRSPFTQAAQCVFVAACVAALFLPMMTNDEYVLGVLNQAGLYVLLGCGLNVVVSLAGLLDLGYIAFFGLGAYANGILASPHYNLHLPFLLVVPAAIAATSLFAVVIGVPTLRVRGDYLAIVTLGFGEIVQIALLNGGSLTGGTSGIVGVDAPKLFGYRFPFAQAPYYYLIFGLCLATLMIGWYLRRSRLGLFWQALRDDELAARSCGIYPMRYYLYAFAIGAGFAGLAGAIFGSLQISVSPDEFTIDQSFVVLGIVVLSGMSGRFWPVLVSGFLLQTLPEFLRFLSQYRLLVFGALLIVVAILKGRSGDLVPAFSDAAKRFRLAARSIESEQEAPPDAR